MHGRINICRRPHASAGYAPPLYTHALTSTQGWTGRKRQFLCLRYDITGKRSQWTNLIEAYSTVAFSTDEKGLLPASCLRQLDVSHLFSKRSLSTEVATANKENVHSLQQPNLTDVRSNDMQNNQNTSMDTTTNHLANEHLSQDGDLNSESATQPAPIELRHVRCYKPKLMKKPNIPKKTPPQSYAKVCVV